MTSFSKEIVTSVLQNYSCRVLLHPGQTCSEATIYNLMHYMKGSAKFFIPVVLIPLSMKLKKMNRKILLDHISYYFELCLAAYSLGNSVTGSVCIIRHFLGKFSYYNIFLYPAIIANLCSFLMAKRVSRIYAISLAQVLIEAQLRAKSNIIARFISESKTLQTLLFMISSSIVLQILKENKFNIFWFMQPIAKNQETKYERGDLNLKSVECNHDEDCGSFIKQGIKSYFLIGLALASVKMIFAKTNTKSKNIYEYMLSKMKSFDPNSIKFLVSYVGLYRGTNCILNRYFNMNSNKVHLVASCTGGLSYMFCSKPIILAYALTSSTELLWKKYVHKDSKSESVKKLAKVNFSRIIIAPGLAIMVHLYVFHNHLVNRLGAGLVNAATNKKALQVHNRVTSILQGCRNPITINLTK